MEGDSAAPPVVVNLDEVARRRPAGELLAAIPWDGARATPDPAAVSAADFLRFLSDD